MTHILITNDDGIPAPGLLALVRALRPLGKLSILAPERNWSGGGHVKTLDKPMRVRETALSDGTPALESDGAPSDCVALALLGLIPEKVDLVVSGINNGENLGYDLTYSGTVTAAMEAVISGVPGIAVSLGWSKDPGACDYSMAADYAALAVRLAVQNGLPPGILLNVNVPCVPREQIRGIQITRQGLRVYRDELVRRQDPQGRPYFWIGGEPPTGVAEEGSDVGAVSGHFVSVTPIQLDLTAYAQIDALRRWQWTL